MKKTISDIAIVGGGAAGMFAAAAACEYGVSTALVEKNEYLGRKLGITGKGRCNITNNTSPNEVINNITTNKKFLYSAVNAFTPEDAMAFFEKIGIRLKTERGNRVFPASDRAAEVVGRLRQYLLDKSAKIINEKVTDISKNDGIFKITAINTEIFAKKVIIATGGMSYPLTGSTGDGYEFAKKFGHTVTELTPSLVPLIEKGGDCKKMQGLSLRNVKLTIYNNKNKEVFSGFGEMLFTHFGLSGPLILSASAHMRDYDKNGFYAVIDLKPALDEKSLDARILRDFSKYPNKNLENALGLLLPSKMIAVFIDRCGISPDKKVNEITKTERAVILRLLKNFGIDILKPRPIEDAIITSGGVSVKEIVPSTMASKLEDGLYFAGEIIDVDAYTGGFNLQIAWSTAYAAACDASLRVLNS